MAAVRDVVEALGGVDAALANHLVMGPAILARAGSPLRGQDPRLGARVHGQTGARALPALRPRGHRRRVRGVGRLPPHGREPLGGDRRPRRSRQDPARPAGRRHGALPAAGRPSARAGRLAELAASVAADEPGGGGAFARDPRAAADAIRRSCGRRRPARRHGRQADRLQGRRPAARGLAPRPRARTPARACWWSASASTRRRCSGCGRRWRPGISTTPARSPSRGRGLEGGRGGPLRMLKAFLDEPPPGTRRPRARRRRQRRVRRPARARRGRPPGAGHRCAGLPEHLPRGLRHGGRRGGRGRRPSGLRRPLGRRRGQPRAGGGAPGGGRASWSRSRSTTAP